MSARVFVTRRAPEQGLALLRDAGFEVVVRPADEACPRAELFEGLRVADALVPFVTDRIDREALAAAPRLRVVACCSVGYDHVDVAAAAERGIRVTNTPGVLTDATAELTWALILSAVRRVVPGDRQVREGRWVGWSPVCTYGFELRGKTLGVVGAGRVGSSVVRIGARGFGMRVVFTALRERPSLEALGAVRKELDDLLAESDVVTLHLPLNAETRGILGRERLARMKPGSVLVNTARGALVDEAALAEALRAGRPAAAGLACTRASPRCRRRCWRWRTSCCCRTWAARRRRRGSG